MSFASILRQLYSVRPIAREFLNRRELHALRLICDGFPFRPPCHFDALAQFGQFRFRNIHMKRTNGGLVSYLLAGLGYGILLLSSFGFLVWTV
jgi:hypothetical protein